MKKVSIFCLAMLLIFSSTFVNFAQGKDEKELESFYKENSLQKVNEVPGGVIPLKVDTIEELKEVINIYDNEFLAEDTNTEVEIIQDNSSALLKSGNSVLADYPTYYFKNITTVYSLSDLGGSLKAEVGYWVVGSTPPVFTVDYIDVYKSGISYNCNIILDEKSATVSANRSYINVRVRGTCEVYVEFYGQLILHTYRFDKQYTIGYVS